VLTRTTHSESVADIIARLDRLPPSRHLYGLVALIAVGGWFEFYEFVMPGGIALGLIHSGIYTEANGGLFAARSFASFLASLFLGMWVGVVGFSWMSDRYGRRSTYTWSMLLYSAAALLVAVSSTAWIINIWRFLAGIGVGIQLISNDAFLSEITPRHTRGRYVAFGYSIVLTATPIAALLSFLLVPHRPLGVDGWRWVVVIGALGGVLVWWVRRELPESPRWLAAHGRTEAAERVITDIERAVRTELGHDLPPPEPTTFTLQHGNWREMFGPQYRSRTLMLSLFQFCQTIAIFGFINWVPIMLVRQGFTAVHSLGYTVMILLLTPVGGLLGLSFAERFQRKWQLVGCAIAIGLFGMVFASARTAPLILGSGALLTLANNWLVVIFHPYAAELFPTRIRSQAIGFTFSWSRVSSIFVGYAVAFLLSVAGTTGVFAMIAIAMAVIVLSIGLLGPRTNGHGLEAISR
jgi:MFS transporter, putative metabolite:H+ symporter